MPNRIMLAVPAVLSVAVAGCGAAHAPRASLPAAAAATAATSSRVSVTLTTGAPGMAVTITGTGAFDYARGRGWLRLGGGGFALEERFLPPRMYVRLPGGVPDAPGRSWLAATVGGAGAAPAIPLLLPGPEVPPADLLTLLSGRAATRVRDLGTGTIQGTPVTHYQASVDLARALATAKPAGQARLRGLAALLGTRRFAVDAWADGAGRVRRVRVTLARPAVKPGQPPATAGGSGFGMTETVTYSRFGIPIRVSAPPVAQVATLPSGAAGGNGVSSILGGRATRGIRPPAPPSAPPSASGTLPAA